MIEHVVCETDVFSRKRRTLAVIQSRTVNPRTRDFRLEIEIDPDSMMQCVENFFFVKPSSETGE